MSKLSNWIMYGLVGVQMTVLPAFGADAKKAAKPVELKISSKGSESVYDKKVLNAKPGQTVKLTFSNQAPKDAGLDHNWVLVQIGAAEEIKDAGIAAGADKGWLPEKHPKVIANTKLLKGGETQTITFTAPDKAGDYPFLCTFPGHFPMMTGTLKVK
jgi:azurin